MGVHFKLAGAVVKGGGKGFQVGFGDEVKRSGDLGAFGVDVRVGLKWVWEEGLADGQKGLGSGRVTPGGKGALVLW